MAEIYLGRVRGTAGFDKLVAIKRVLPQVAMDQAFVDMFLAEARLAATLRHPNIADVFDVGIVNGSYFLAMEFIHGQDLRALRIESINTKRQLPIEISLAIVSGIASALAYAHSRVGPSGPLKLVHRDISPSNILVSYDGAVKLVDFGIARAGTNTTATVTRTGQLKGKIPYMSPEQCRAKSMDGRADLFSLGIVLYELTTGVRPFDGKGDFDTLERIVHGHMRRPTEIVANYPPMLEAIVLRMLANRRRDRYQTADALVADLETLTSQQGMFASAFMVGKFMREMFPEEAHQLPHLDVDDDDDDEHTHAEEFVDIADPSPQTSTRKYPRAEQASGLYAIDAETVRVPRDELKIVFRQPTGGMPVADTTRFDPVESPFESPFGDEGSTIRGDVTQADVFSPFDPIASKATEMLAAIDPSCVEDRDMSLQTIGELLQRAAMWSDEGHYEDAVIATDLVLSADRTTPGVLDLFAKNIPFMTAVFEAYLGDCSRMPALSQHIDEIGELPLDRRGAYMLSMIDGTCSAAELLARVDMPPIEAYRHLSLLVLRRVVVLV